MQFGHAKLRHTPEYAAQQASLHLPPYENAAPRERPPNGGPPAPSASLYAAFFALKDAGKAVDFSDWMLLHFPTVFCDTKAPGPALRRNAKALFAEYTWKFEGVPHALVNKGLTAMARHLLDSYQ